MKKYDFLVCFKKQNICILYGKYDANNQINDVLSKMTALGTVLVPMNLVTGKSRPVSFI